MSEQNNTEKKTPFYKKKWFIAIIVIIVIAAIFDQGKDDKAEPKDVAVEEKEEKEKPKESEKEEEKEKKEEKDSVEKESKDGSKDEEEKDSNTKSDEDNNKVKDTNKQPEEYTTERGYELIEEKKGDIVFAVHYFIEDKEMQKIKSRISNTSKYVIVPYTSEDLHDKQGNAFPISFMITGRYEEKGSGKLNDFAMVLGYKNEEEISKPNAYLLQYVNDQTGTYFNSIPEDEDVLLQLNKALEENQ